jgi:hypothetical protein
MKARQKRRLAGPTTGCCTNKASCIEEKQRVRPPAVRYTQKNNTFTQAKYLSTQQPLGNQLSGILRKAKKNKYIHTNTNMHVGMYDCMRSESESELANQLSGILKKKNPYVCV